MGMRRREKEITDLQEIEAILRRAQVCRLALVDGDRPYIVPMNFGYERGILYFLCAPEGRKLEILRRNRHVCFEVDVDHELMTGGAQPCRWGMRYRSVIGFGSAFFIEDATEKRGALAVIMGQYAEGEFDFPEEEVTRTTVFKVEIETMTGKKSG